MIASSCGLSRASRGSPEIVSTVSIPLVTFPKTVCLPSSQGHESAVTMKNCEPFVFGPPFAIASAACDLVLVELVLELVSGPARSGPRRIAALDHEIRDDAGEDQLVVEAVARKLDEVVDRVRRVVGVEHDVDRTAVRVMRSVQRNASAPCSIAEAIV